MARKWLLGALQPTSKYTEGVFPTDEQTNPHNSCNRTEDSFSHTTVRPAVSALLLVVIELDCQGGQEYLRYSKSLYITACILFSIISLYIMFWIWFMCAFQICFTYFRVFVVPAQIVILDIRFYLLPWLVVYSKISVPSLIFN